jgi:hypothetical protein
VAVLLLEGCGRIGFPAAGDGDVASDGKPADVTAGLAFYYTLDAAEHTLTGNGTRVLTPGTWYLITGVYDPAAMTMHVYVDGVLDDGAMSANSSAIGSSLNASGMCAYLAASGNQNQLFIAALDEARIYDRPLSAADVAQLYAHY